MSKENAGAEPRQLSVAFPLTVAAMEKGRTIREAISKGETVTLEPVVVKGNVQRHPAQEPTLWELYDILWEVRWQLSYQVWNLQAIGQTDFSEILSLWAEALDEFKAAAIISFRFWNDIADADLEIETDDEMLSNALELEKSLKSVAGAIESATDGDARKHLRAAGERIIELAKSIDILPEDSAAGAPQIPEADQTEEMRKQLADAETREADLRTRLDEANGDLEIAKAGLNRFWILDLGFRIGRTAADRVESRRRVQPMNNL
ncbi:MAG: hypothetical protein IPK58_04445 [Acidobacteria bacterium]|nr:hypothetical protein [Acidobacteriota bacterium]